MKRFYIKDNEPELFSLPSLIGSFAKGDILEIDQSGLERLIKLQENESATIKQSSIKRII